MRIPCDSIWLPDIVLYNSADDYTAGYMKSLAIITYNGSVQWPPIVRFRSSCKIDITFFPFDDQVCYLRLGSWAYDGTQVDVIDRPNDPMDISRFTDNGEWMLYDSTTSRRTVYFDCCPEPFPDVTFYLHIRRRTTYYTMNIIVPCLLLTILTIGGFQLPVQSGEKITLGLTVLLSFSVFMLLIAETIPATSDSVPLLGMYLTVTMAMTSMSVLGAVFILHIHHKGATNRRAPRWLRRLALLSSRIVCARISSALSDSVTKTAQPTLEVKNKSQKRKEQIKNESKQGDDVSSYNKYFRTSSLREVTLTTLENGQFIVHKNEKYGHQSEVQTQPKPTEDELVKKLHDIILKRDSDDLDEVIRNEWQDIAVVLDRICFWVFFSVAVMSTVSLLALKPLAKDLKILTESGIVRLT